MRRVVLALAVVDTVIFVISFLFGNKTIIWSMQIGFWSSALIVLASFKSYKRAVESRVEGGEYAFDDRDVIDKLDDPHNLYSEDDENKEEKNFREIIKEEKARMKQNRRTIYSVVKDSAPAFSLFRLSSYLILVFGFFYLKSSAMLNIPFYLLSLGIPIIATVWTLMSEKESDVK